MAGRQSRGRQRIPIRYIENMNDLYPTFSKRRLGLFKKASELSTLCGIDIGIIIFSPTNIPHSFFHPNMESVVRRHRNQHCSDYARIVEIFPRARIKQLNEQLDDVLTTKEEFKEREKYLDGTRKKGWWERTTFENLNKDEVYEWIACFENLRAQIANQNKEIKNNGSAGIAMSEKQQEECIFCTDFPDMTTDDPVATNPDLPDNISESEKLVSSNFQLLPGPSSSSDMLVQDQFEQIPDDIFNFSRPNFEEDPFPGSENLDFNFSPSNYLPNTSQAQDWPSEDGHDDGKSSSHKPDNGSKSGGDGDGNGTNS
ncbi:MADS-box transcription factor 22-like [Andrographis paniculata]|uniref:MADS-box transcription factor 22-like n=1 Tax=Andrographis paniculata TaxID=175694 RepID=UPI0021E8499F|nr:MADS-box transcription factor 22-like [Andrographis paniculata]